MVSATVVSDLTNHKALRDALATGNGPVKEVMRSWERRYRTFITRRFDRFSRGGGDWRQLSPMTVASKGSTAILVDTRAMRLGLGVGVRAISVTQNTVTFSFVNEAQHPTAQMPIAALLTRHDRGIGTPKRPILVVPDDETKVALVNLAVKDYTDFANGKR